MRTVKLGERRKSSMKERDGRFPTSPWWGGVSFGGLPKGRSAKTNPKTKRPFSSKHAIHLVLRSEKAVKRNSFQHEKHFRFVNRAVTLTARRYGIRLHKTANVGNHLHILLGAKTREEFIRFSRRLAAVIACGIGGGRRGQPREKFWTGRPFSRVVLGGAQAFWRAESYVILNQLEAAGVLPPRALARLGPPGSGKRLKLLSLARRLAYNL